MAALSPSEAVSSSSNESTLKSIDQSIQRDAAESDEIQFKTPFGVFGESNVTNAYAKMLNPVFDDIEQKVQASTRMLDKLNSEMEADREERRKKRLSAHIPEALRGGGESPDEVLRKLEQLIFFAEVEGTDEVELQEHIRLQELDTVGKTSLIANSLKSYISRLPEVDLRRVTSKINADCHLWLSRLFRFENSGVMYHEEEREGLVRICRLALYNRYPKYATDGFAALYSRPPVIYLSGAASPGLGQYLCLQLGLPLSCICTVSCNTMFGASSKMDVAMLEKLIQDDVGAVKTPVLLLAYAGTPLVGHVDNLQRLQEICKANNIWLHVEGSHLSTLTLFSVPTEVSSAKSGDSITVCPGTWLGIPGLPHATLYKLSDPTLVFAAGLNTFEAPLKLSCLPYWMCLLTLGHEGIVKRITHACDLAKFLYDKLDHISTIKQISREKKDPSKKKEYKSLMDLLSKAISALLVFEMASPTVVFRYAQDSAGPGSIVAPYSAREGDEPKEKNDDSLYYDALNIWLAESISDNNPSVTVDTVEVEREGVCIRYSPLESALAKGTTKDDMEAFVNSLVKYLSVLNATTTHRKHFQSAVNSQPNLTLSDLHNWAGLGAARYVPDVYQGREDLEERDLLNVDALNAEVIHQLKTKDSAFSLGRTDCGRVVIKFGLITEDTDVEELVEMVQSQGRDVEESSKFLESMSERIRKGIEEANQELQKENLTKLQHEGVLRQLPIMGSMLNWLSPIREEVKGRSFNLTSGRIVSTQDTYKFHMQLQEEGGGPPHPPSRNPSVSSAQGEGSTTAGQVKAQLVRQTPPTTPTSATPAAATPTLTPTSTPAQLAQADSPEAASPVASS